ncbi:M28 family peptidase [Planctomycetes bacterium K23_9]|uniref:Aminopeptidase YwaD n=1 Tax=Stieleria marina TaxID=1930275 RepID=A0A517NS03_9BACT|nr:Aminopeptidase YwaD precursor [Planctomycetes bacterium K23_9]
MTQNHLAPVSSRSLRGILQPIASLRTLEIASIARSISLLTLLVFVNAPAFADTPANTLPRDAEPTETIRSQLERDVRYLASEELRGRDVGDETIHLAARYVVDRMKACGLQIDTIGGTAYQSVPVDLGAQPGSPDQNFANFTFGESDNPPLSAKLGESMNPMAAGPITGSIADRPVVFAGYGITAPDLKYDDYAGINAKDAVVIVLRKEPRASDPRSPFDGVRNTRHAYFTTKIKNAVAHGAAAILFVNDPNSVDEAQRIIRYKIQQEENRDANLRKQMATLPAKAKNSRNKFQMQIDGVTASIQALKLERNKASRGLLGISEAGTTTFENTKIPVVSIARDTVDQLIRNSSPSSLELAEKTINERLRPDSRVLTNVTCTLKIKLKPTSANSPNVVGVIAGKGELANETVIVGAHYDHVGMGGYGSLAPGTVEIHNGADDNASGVATMLGAAAMLAPKTKTLRSHRRIVFIAFTGEERGLVGSRYYVEHPLYSLETTAAMINLDMVGRLRDNELTVYGTGSAEGLDAMVEQVNEVAKFSLYKIPSGYGPSDHMSFYKAGVPVLFYFTGLHNDYHRPSDDFDKIDFGGMSRITDTVSNVTLQLAVRSQRPRYVETENKVQIRRQLSVYMGISLSDRSDHVVISYVGSDSPAKQSGLIAGDQLSRIGRRRIRTSTDVFDLLRNHSPGDSLQVQVLRRGKPLDVVVKLGKRPPG